MDTRLRLMQNLMNQRVDDYRLRLRGREFVPLMLGGMGVDISTRRLALVMAQEGGIGHISDAMVPTVIDKDFKTRYVADKLKKYKGNVEKSDKSIVQFDLAEVIEAQRRHVEEAMAAKKGDGAIFINCMWQARPAQSGGLPFPSAHCAARRISTTPA